MDRKRSIADRLICGFNDLRYGITEPILLSQARKNHESEYQDKNEKPLISVYVPTYNRARILMERAVPTVLKQSYTNFEFIILGDHCTDETAELVSTIKDPRVRFHNLPTRSYRYPPTPENHWFAGPVVAANAALDMVRGKWIARIDDDDLWSTDHLDVLLDVANQGNYEFVSAAYEAEKNGKRYIVDVKDEDPPIGGTQTWLYRSYLKFFRYNINCWRKSWNRVNDTDIQDRMHKAGVRMGYTQHVVAQILPRPGETTIGLEAYRQTAQDKIDHFKFE